MNGPSTVLSGLFAGRYAIERELGRGGSAIVYLARDQQRGHLVAIKVLRPEFAESLGADRFLKEIRVSEQLHHPSILPVLDSGKHDGQLYFVLPYMEEGTLRQRLEREKQLTLDEVVAIARSVGAALAHAHEKGLIHRDVKPENILFTSGQACLADFGIARALERAMGDTTTSTSVVRGTPQYMSPEQASGEATLDGRSDVYSFGCVLYEMLAGIEPFVGPTPQSVIAQRLSHAPRPLRMYRPALSRAIERVVDKALVVSRADRYQTASDLADDLELAARQSGETETRDDAARSWKKYALFAGAFALAAVAAIMLVTRGPSESENGIPDGDPRRVAVLYLDDLTPSTVPAFIADGITEDLIDRLGGVSALHVTSPYGVRPFRASPIPLDSIGRALNVGTIVTGSVARSGNTMRVHVRLVDAATGRQISSNTLEESWTELFALQDKLVNQVAFVLRQRLGSEIALREHRRATGSYEAWETAQRASAETQRALAASRRNDPQAPSLFLHADSLYARAEQLDPAWILPTIRRGRIAIAVASQSPTPPNQSDSIAYRALARDQQRLVWLRRALELAESAIRRSPRSAEALALRGDANYELFTRIRRENDSLVAVIERDLRSAVEIRADAAGAWSTLAQLWYVQGKFGDAAAAAQRAFEADAFFEVRRTVSVALNASLYAERFDDARRWCRFSLEHYPDDSRFSECELTLLGWTGRSRKDVDAAWRLVSAAERRDTAAVPDDMWAWAYRRIMVAAVLARAGLRDSARNVLVAMQEQQRKDPNRRMSPLGEAYVHLLLHNRDSALVHLSDYLRSATAARRQIAQHPWFRPLHGDPRFEALVRPSR